MPTRDILQSFSKNPALWLRMLAQTPEVQSLRDLASGGVPDEDLPDIPLGKRLAVQNPLKMLPGMVRPNPNDRTVKLTMPWWAQPAPSPTVSGRAAPRNTARLPLPTVRSQTPLSKEFEWTRPGWPINPETGYPRYRYELTPSERYHFETGPAATPPPPPAISAEAVAQANARRAAAAATQPAVQPALNTAPLAPPGMRPASPTAPPPALRPASPWGRRALAAGAASVAGLGGGGLAVLLSELTGGEAKPATMPMPGVGVLSAPMPRPTWEPAAAYTGEGPRPVPPSQFFGFLQNPVAPTGFAPAPLPSPPRPERPPAIAPKAGGGIIPFKKIGRDLPGFPGRDVWQAPDGRLFGSDVQLGIDERGVIGPIVWKE